MNLEDIRLSQVKYQMKVLTVTAGNTSFNVPPSQIVMMKWEKNFYEDNYPFAYIAMNLPGWFYMEVVKNPNKLYITLDLHSTTYRDSFDERMNNPTTKSECKGKFIADIAIDTPIATEEEQLKFEREDGSYKKTYAFNEYYFTEFTIQNPAALSAKSIKINRVLSSTNMTTTIAYLCANAGISNILMTPLSNRNSYSEFITENINVVDQLNQLSNKYGFHKSGTIIFFDLDRTYIISKDIGCTAWRKNEYKNVHVMSLNQYSAGLAGSSGYYVNNKEKYHLVQIPPNNMESVSIGNLPISTGNYNIKNALRFKTEDICLEALTPNKLYIVDIQASSAKSQINGRYRLVRYSIQFEPSGNFLSAQFDITLGK